MEKGQDSTCDGVGLSLSPDCLLVCGLNVDSSPADLSELLCDCRAACASGTPDRGGRGLVFTLALTICRAHQDRAGVLATAGAICGNPPTPAGAITTGGPIHVEDCLVEPVSFRRSKRPALGYRDGAHGLRREVKPSMAHLTEVLDQL